MVADGQNHLYLTTYDGIGFVDLSTGMISSFATTSNPSGPTVGSVAESGIAFDGDHTLYVASFMAVFSIDVSTGLASELVRFPSQFTGPDNYLGVAVDGKGNLYVSDGVSRVFGIDIATGAVTTVAGTPATNIPVIGYGGDGGPATSALLDMPSGLRYDGAGHLLIADTANDAIRSVDLTTDVITTVAGNGAPGFTGDGGNPGAADLYYPLSVSIDSAGNLLIADTDNDRIRRVVLHPAVLSGTLTASSSNPTAGDMVTLTATFSGLSLGLPPTAAATFYDGTTALTGSSSTVATNTNGFTATVTTSSLAVGTHSITARFAGDGNYAPVTTAAVTITVTTPPPPVPNFTLSASPTTLSIIQGSTGTAVITLTPTNAFNQAVTFSYEVTALPGTTPLGDTGVTCSFSPATVTTSGTTPVTTTVTFSPAPGSASLTFPLNRPTSPLAATGLQGWFPCSGAAALACVLMFGWRGARRRSRGLWIAVTGCVLLAGSGLGCGSGSSSGSGPSGPQSATYPVNVTATVGTGANAVSASVMVFVASTK
jgi:hypothetical protein